MFRLPLVFVRLSLPLQAKPQWTSSYLFFVTFLQVHLKDQLPGVQPLGQKTGVFLLWSILPQRLDQFTLSSADVRSVSLPPHSCHGCNHTRKFLAIWYVNIVLFLIGLSFTVTEAEHLFVFGHFCSFSSPWCFLIISDSIFKDRELFQPISPSIFLLGHPITFKTQTVYPKLSLPLPQGMMGQRHESLWWAWGRNRGRIGNLPEPEYSLSPHHHAVHSNEGQIRAAAGGRDKRLGQPEGSGY